MRAVVRKWGNSASVRLPASVMAAVGLCIDQAVDIREETGRIILEPIRPPSDELAALIAGITDENRHDAVDTGPAVGREFW